MNLLYIDLPSYHPHITPARQVCTLFWRDPAEPDDSGELVNLVNFVILEKLVILELIFVTAP